MKTTKVHKYKHHVWDIQWKFICIHYQRNIALLIFLYNGIFNFANVRWHNAPYDVVFESQLGVCSNDKIGAIFVWQHRIWYLIHDIVHRELILSCNRDVNRINSFGSKLFRLSQTIFFGRGERAKIISMLTLTHSVLGEG